MTYSLLIFCLIYAAARGAGDTYESETFHPENADIDQNGVIDASDAANVLIYAAIAGSEGAADWEMVRGKDEAAA